MNFVFVVCTNFNNHAIRSHHLPSFLRLPGLWLINYQFTAVFNATHYRLPRKSDTERKTSIYQFSNRTQLQFIRLLALVKWACKASRVDKCTEIIMFLDKQAALFVETADSLFTISKERLMGARYISNYLLNLS